MEVLSDDGNEAQLKCGDMTFFVEDSPTGYTFLDFKVEDIETAKTELLNAGCQVAAAETPEGTKSYLVIDPYGLRFHLYQ